MSGKARERLMIMVGVQERKRALVQTGDLMEVCYRLGKRIGREFPDESDAGLVHRLPQSGQPGRHKHLLTVSNLSAVQYLRCSRW